MTSVVVDDYAVLPSGVDTFHCLPDSSETALARESVDTDMRSGTIKVRYGTGHIEIPDGYNLEAWFYRALAKVISFSELENDWDGYGSERIDPIAVVHALNILLALMPASGRPEASVTATSSGGVQFDWDCVGDYLEIESRPDRVVEYLYALGSEEREGEIESWEDLWRIREVLASLSSQC